MTRVGVLVSGHIGSQWGSKVSEAASEYDDLMRQLIKMINSGDGKSGLADALRDKMDDPWSRMTDDERAAR